MEINFYNLCESVDGDEREYMAHTTSFPTTRIAREFMEARIPEFLGFLGLPVNMTHATAIMIAKLDGGYVNDISVVCTLLQTFNENYESAFKPGDRVTYAYYKIPTRNGVRHPLCRVDHLKGEDTVVLIMENDIPCLLESICVINK